MSSGYIQFQFFKPPASDVGWSGWEARRWFAAQMDGKPEAEAVLHYKNGIPDGGYPHVRFLGGKNNFRIVGLGKRGIKAVTDASINFHRLDDKPMRVQMTGGDISLSPSDGLLYSTTFIPNRKLAGALRVAEASKDGISKKFKKWIKGKLYAGMAAQIEALNLPFDNFELHVCTIKIKTPAPINVQNDKTILAPRVEVLFILDCELKGPWSVGCLTSRGHGVIKRVHVMTNNVVDKVPKNKRGEHANN